MSAEVTGATRPAVVGHRGAGDLEPENTLAAFSRAIELELDAVELDVRLTRDGCSTTSGWTAPPVVAGRLPSTT